MPQNTRFRVHFLCPPPSSPLLPSLQLRILCSSFILRFQLNHRHGCRCWMESHPCPVKGPWELCSSAGPTMKNNCLLSGTDLPLLFAGCCRLLLSPPPENAPPKRRAGGASPPQPPPLTQISAQPGGHGVRSARNLTSSRGGLWSSAALQLPPGAELLASSLRNFVLHPPPRSPFLAPLSARSRAPPHE